MTYNIRYDNPGDGVNAWPNRKEKVVDLIKKYDPDVLGVQEALYHQLEYLADQLKDYKRIGVGRDDGKTKGEFSAIFYKKSRLKASKNGTFWLSPTPEVPGSKGWDAAITRIATWAYLKDKKSGKEFLMMNSHFDHRGDEARVKSAELIKKKIPELSHGMPALFSGDLNIKRDHPAYAELIKPTDGVILKDPAPADAPGTFCSFIVGSMKCNGIDYIFTTPEWTTEKYQVINDNDGTNYPSDHQPVMITVKL